MGIFNRIIAIFILLAAAGAAVLSYFLFEKRTQMIDGWNMLSDEIAATGKALDENSGTSVASSLSKDKLHHRNTLGELQSNLKVLRVSAGNIVKQRDALADTVFAVATTLDVNPSDLNVAEMKDNAKSAEAQNNALAAAKSIRSRNDKIVADYKASGEKLGIFSSESEIKTDSSKLAGEIADKVDAKNTRISTYESNLASISSEASGPALDNSEEGYKSSASAIADSVRKQRETLQTRENELADANNMIASLTDEKKGLQTEIVTHKKTISDRDILISELKHKLNPSENPDIDEHLFGKKDYQKLYSLVQGSVKKVDTKWNFVILDIGQTFDVKQTVAGRTFSTLLNIPNKVTMTVVRNLGSDSPQFIAKVYVTEVYNDYSVANIDTAHQKASIKEGDSVIYLNDDIAKVLATISPVKDTAESAEVAAAPAEE